MNKPKSKFNNKNGKSLSAVDKFGIISSTIGLIADFIALAAFGYSLLNYNSIEGKPNVTITLWIGILLIVPLIYSWGVLAWLANSKYGKPHLAVALTGIALLPLYVFWGILVLAEAFPAYRIINANGYSPQNVITAESRATGGVVMLTLQLVLGFLLFSVLLLWNKFIGIVPEKEGKS